MSERDQKSLTPDDATRTERRRYEPPRVVEDLPMEAQTLACVTKSSAGCSLPRTS